MNTTNKKILYSCACDVGLSRKENQDNFICNGIYLNADSITDHFSFTGAVEGKPLPLFGVFDGMGGEECGEIAAYIAAKEAAALKIGDQPEKDLRNFCYEANRKICAYADENGIFSMGTTAAMLVPAENQIYLCNIGDSKIFHFDHTTLKQLSVDHLAQMPVGRKPLLSQNLGIPEDVMVIEPYVQKFGYGQDDVFIICSDGLTDMVSLEEMWKIIANTEIESLAGMLMDKALKNGGKDNVTVIAIKPVKGE